MNINEELEQRKLYCGRMISASKDEPNGQKCVWNANIITRSGRKVWFGDLNLTKEGKLLKAVANAIGEPLYVLREHDCRFDTAEDPIDTLISKAVWNTNEP